MLSVSDKNTKGLHKSDGETTLELNTVTVQKKSKEVENIRPSANENFKALYIFNGSDFIKLQENSTIKYLRSLLKALEQSKGAVDLLNRLNELALEKIQLVTINEVVEVADIKLINDQIEIILGNVKKAFDLAKDAPNRMSTIKDLETKILRGAQQELELYGGAPKAFREDPMSIIDNGEPSVLNINNRKIDGEE